MISPRMRHLLECIAAGAAQIDSGGCPRGRWFIGGLARQPSRRETDKIYESGWIRLDVNPHQTTITPDGMSHPHFIARLTDAGKAALQ